ncbi:MAG: hypothetical protein HZA25_02545, partial [Candidatus Niyogibacteria bacterium]|nr:hypothetical protein [Candidatus Niyogibacteria bacterium]
EALSSGKILTDKEILRIVITEFKKEEYEEKSQELKKGWVGVGEDFLKKLETLGLPLEREYEVLFTKYGVGGSYGLPNNIQINFAYTRDILSITLHEIIHLTVEELIKKYDIDHWTKERLVDLIYGRFFPEGQRLQDDPDQAEKIHKIFDSFFPNIEKVITEVSLIPKI